MENASSIPQWTIAMSSGERNRSRGVLLKVASKGLHNSICRLPRGEYALTLETCLWNIAAKLLLLFNFFERF